MKLELRHILLVFLVVGCSEAKFDGGPKATSPPSAEDQKPEKPGAAVPSDGKTTAKLVSSSYDAAQPKAPGKATFSFMVTGMKPGEIVTKFDWAVHTVDFSNISPDLSAGGDDGANSQKINVTFDFKWTPNITRYQGQVFKFTLKETSGSERTISTAANVTICDKQKSDCTVELSLSGTAGNPGAQ